MLVFPGCGYIRTKAKLTSTLFNQAAVWICRKEQALDVHIATAQAIVQRMRSLVDEVLQVSVIIWMASAAQCNQATSLSFRTFVTSFRVFSHDGLQALGIFWMEPEHQKLAKSGQDAAGQQRRTMETTCEMPSERQQEEQKCQYRGSPLSQDITRYHKHSILCSYIIGAAQDMMMGISCLEQIVPNKVVTDGHIIPGD